MALSVPAILKDKWALFVKYGITKSCSYQKMADTTYVASSNTVTKLITSSHPVEVVFDEIKAVLVDEETIFRTDRIAIFPVLNIPVEAAINDIIVDNKATEWEVKRVNMDPADAHYELLVRPQNKHSVYP